MTSPSTLPPDLPALKPLQDLETRLSIANRCQRAHRNGQSSPHVLCIIVLCIIVFVSLHQSVIVLLRYCSNHELWIRASRHTNASHEVSCLVIWCFLISLFAEHLFLVDSFETIRLRHDVIRATEPSSNDFVEVWCQNKNSTRWYQAASIYLHAGFYFYCLLVEKLKNDCLFLCLFCKQQWK